jgi:Ca2+-binding EF-hand superfamily protein
MIKKLLFSFLFRFVSWAFNKLIDLIDKDHNGEIDEQELQMFVEKIEEMWAKIRGK